MNILLHTKDFSFQLIYNLRQDSLIGFTFSISQNSALLSSLQSSFHGLNSCFITLLHVWNLLCVFLILLAESNHFIE